MRSVGLVRSGGGTRSGLESDGVLIERSVRGRPDAFADVARRHEVAIHGYLARRAGRQAADDLLGEVWLRAFAARGGYDARHGDARPWLYGIARNVLREHWRTAAATIISGGGSGGGGSGGGGGGGSGGSGGGEPAALGEPVVDPWDGVNDRLDAGGRAEAVMSAVRALPAAEREVLLLVAWEELTPGEAAEVLGVPQGTARSRLHRARAALRRALDEHDTVVASPRRAEQAHE